MTEGLLNQYNISQQPTALTMLERREFAERYYLFHEPHGVPAFVNDPPQRAGRALVLAFHGGGSDPLGMARFSGLVEAADRQGFLLAFPAGSGPVPEYLTWNAGSCCGHAARRNVDDVAFIRALLDDLASHLEFDPQRVYATGMSNGGMFCYRLAAAMPERIAAIAPVAGCLAFNPPPLSRPVPVLHFHGTVDQFVPYAGGAGERSLRQINFPSVDETLRHWASACGLVVEKSEPVPLSLAAKGVELANDQPLSAYRTAYAHTDGKEAVVEIRVDGGGHTWPGQAPPLCFLGRTMLSISANERMWEFFEQLRL